MTTAAAVTGEFAGRARGPAGLGLAARLALRDLRGGIRGFGVFLACLAIGVGAVATVLSLSRALEEGVAAEGRVILGGDVALSRVHIRAAAGERGFMQARGRVSEAASLRAMARAGDEAPALVEIKAVDDLYPLYGEVTLEPAMPLGDALAGRGDLHGVAVAEELATRLGLGIGDRLEIGDGAYVLGAVIGSEPDRLGEGLAFGPRVMMSLDGLEASGLIRPGSLVRWTYRMALDGDGPDSARASSGESLDRFVSLAEERFEPEGWRLRTRESANPGIARFIDRLTLFMTLIGLTALVVGGVGVANATSAHLGAKARVIATLKCLGAPSALVFRVYFAEVMVLAACGVAIGLALGAGLPFVIEATLGEIIPVPLRVGVYPEPLGFAAACGLLTAITFSLWPLGRAQQIAPAALFRDIVAPARARPRGAVIFAIGLAAAGLAALVIMSADDRRFAAYYVAGAAASFAVLLALGRGLVWAMRRMPRPRRATLRLGLANIARPGAATPGVVLSLGLGLTLFVMVGLIDANLQRELASELPERAPSFFFLDVQRSEEAAFDRLLADTPGIESVTKVAMLRGHIVKVKGVPSSEVEPTADGWVLRGDRGMTFARAAPDGTRIVRGEWWPEDYRGEQLVSFAEEPARGLGLEIGDTITVSVLGRDLEARVASTRDVNWRSLNVNFVMVFSPGPIEAAPHALLVSVAMASEGEGDLVRRVAAELPTVTVIRVKDALEAVSELLESLMLAIRSAGVVAIVTGMLVLGGAIAAGRRTRIYDAVILKTFGATRASITAAYLAEFVVLGAITALFALIAGSIAAYFVVVEAMEFGFRMSPGVAASIIAAGVAATVIVGFIGTWTALGARAAPILRSP